MIESRTTVFPSASHTHPTGNRPPCHPRDQAPGVPAPAPRSLPGPFAGRSFVGADLQGVDFSQRDMRHADLRGADLFMARFEGADLRGALLDMTRIVEIHVPADLPVHIVNQIRAFDFLRAQTRIVAPNRLSEPLPCPYASSTLRPVLYAWGSGTWNEGARWAPPRDPWTLEEIIAAVLSTLGCKHDLTLPHGLLRQAQPL